jgi:aldose 1-epimerase
MKIRFKTQMWMMAGIFLAFGSCNNASNQQQSENKDSGVVEFRLPDTTAFQQTIDGKQTSLYVLKNKNNAEAADGCCCRFWQC